MARGESLSFPLSLLEWQSWPAALPPLPHLRARRLLPRAIISSTPPPPIVSFLILIIRQTLDLVCNSTWPLRLQGAAPLPSPVKSPSYAVRVCVTRSCIHVLWYTHTIRSDVTRSEICRDPYSHPRPDLLSRPLPVLVSAIDTDHTLLYLSHLYIFQYSNTCSNPCLSMPLCSCSIDSKLLTFHLIFSPNLILILSLFFLFSKILMD